MGAAALLAKAEEIKAKGNEFFKNGDYKKAITSFARASEPTRGCLPAKLDNTAAWARTLLANSSTRKRRPSN